MADPRAAAEAGPRVRAAARTRQSLLDAGLRLAETTGLEGLSVNLLVDNAGVSKGTFFHHFGDRTAYLVELHREFHDRLVAEVLQAIDGLAPGRDRLLVVASTYLDACLRDRGVKALLLEARGSTLIVDEIAARNAQTADLLDEDFRVLGWSSPKQGARLWIAMTAEAALIELERGRKHADTRDALAQFTDAHDAARRAAKPPAPRRGT